VSTTSLARPWSDLVKERAGAPESLFDELDKVLGSRDRQVPLSMVKDADIWYVVDDANVDFPVDPSPGLGLDTWDF
jgi:hypothetical protein